MSVLSNSLPLLGLTAVVPPPFIDHGEGDAMALPPHDERGRVPYTPLPSGPMDLLGPTALVVQPSDYIPPPLLKWQEENIWCSPVD